MKVEIKDNYSELEVFAVKQSNLYQFSDKSVKIIQDALDASANFEEHEFKFSLLCGVIFGLLKEDEENGGKSSS